MNIDRESSGFNLVVKCERCGLRLDASVVARYSGSYRGEAVLEVELCPTCVKSAVEEAVEKAMEAIHAAE